jgi:hypothetical protein
MTKFSEQLFDDLMREHGPALASTRPPARPRHHAAARLAALAGGGTLAVAGAVAGTLVAVSGTPVHVAGTGTPAPAAKTPAYSLTKNPDGTITLAVYQTSGIAAANTRLKALGDKQVVVVPVRAGCPSMRSLPKPAVSPLGKRIAAAVGISRDGAVTVNAAGIPAGDILVVAVERSGNNIFGGTAAVTSPPAPSCVSLPAPPPGHAASSPQTGAGGGSGPATGTGGGSQ